MLTHPRRFVSAYKHYNKYSEVNISILQRVSLFVFRPKLRSSTARPAHTITFSTPWCRTHLEHRSSRNAFICVERSVCRHTKNWMLLAVRCLTSSPAPIICLFSPNLLSDTSAFQAKFACHHLSNAPPLFHSETIIVVQLATQLNRPFVIACFGIVSNKLVNSNRMCSFCGFKYLIGIQNLVLIRVVTNAPLSEVISLLLHYVFQRFFCESPLTCLSRKRPHQKRFDLGNNWRLWGHLASLIGCLNESAPEWLRWNRHNCEFTTVWLAPKMSLNRWVAIRYIYSVYF